MTMSSGGGGGGNPVLRLRLRRGTFERAPYEVRRRGEGWIVIVDCDFPVRPDHALRVDPVNVSRVIEVSGAEAQVFTTSHEAQWALEQWERQQRGEA